MFCCSHLITGHQLRSIIMRIMLVFEHFCFVNNNNNNNNISKMYTKSRMVMIIIMIIYHDHVL